MSEKQMTIQAVEEHEAAMAAAQEEREAEIHRRQVEWVFALTGGELENKRWEPFVPKLDHEDYSPGMGWSPAPHFERTSFRYWYEGVPSYAESSHEWALVSHRTVVSCILYGSEPNEVSEKGRRWIKVAEHTSSGETTCDCDQAREDGEFVGENREGSEPGTWCSLCETDDTDDRHLIYLGDGWAETVYREIPTCVCCGADLTEDERDVYDDHCDKCVEHEWKVVWACERTLYRGSNVLRAYGTFLAACSRAGEDHYVRIDRDGDTIADNLSETS